MHPAVIRVQNHNILTGNITFNESIIDSYNRGEISSIIVMTENNIFLEEYYGKRLQWLIADAYKTSEGYMKSRRNLFKSKKSTPKPTTQKAQETCGCSNGYNRKSHGPVCVCDDCM